jgi:nicotinamidase-related amidase
MDQRLLVVAIFLMISPMITPLSAGADALNVTLRSRSKASDGKEIVTEKKATWAPAETALIICDMWDDHWCRSAAKRVDEMAGPLNAVVQDARAKGILIIHAPSSVVDYYEKTAQRKQALSAPFAKPAKPLATAERWGTAWCWPDPKREEALPIDDSDMGCDCPQKCEIREAWKRQHPAIEIAAGDALTDNGQETYNLLQQHGIKHVILAGVHLNMCVLGRPFGIRQLVNVGKDVALMRDMTDTMYDPRRRPFVSHFDGTDLVISSCGATLVSIVP